MINKLNAYKTAFNVSNVENKSPGIITNFGTAIYVNGGIKTSPLSETIDLKELLSKEEYATLDS